MEYDFRKIEKEWQQKWKETDAYTVSNDSAKPAFYVLDMFPYPSGVGLHVGHPLGYIASDIYARYKRLKGYNVLHPMGYDAFGLPAEQFAIENGIHPAVSTDRNIANFRRQLDAIGFSFDWSRELRTSDPTYYRWTQWIFLQLFNSYFNQASRKAEHIDGLVQLFEKFGSDAPGVRQPGQAFSATDWEHFDEAARHAILMDYRLAYCGFGEVNWCEALGTVLANDEVVNGVSERGGYPVVKKKLRQWYLRITEYAERLLEGLERIEFSEAMKEMQSNWIGRSYGAEIDFPLSTESLSRPGNEVKALKVYTTRPDTIFGVDFMVIAPEHELIASLTSPEQKTAVDEYVAYVQSRSERERMAEKRITGCFTGGFVIHPFSGKSIPVWISEYVLAGYGTGAIMAVPCGDERDFKFAQHFNIPITNIIGEHYNGEEANPTKDALLSNSDFLNGLVMRDAITVVNARLETTGIGAPKINYKMRDAAFSRQRYWGEPIPIIWKNGIAYPLNENELPLQLPVVESYSAGPDGESPLANITGWVHPPDLPGILSGGQRETNTMPGYAGSSWYFLRYMDPHNTQTFCDRKVSDYWGQVDLYIGGTEHAVGHLLYSRMWTKALFDLGYIGFDEPFKKLVNQGMIQGSSRFVYRDKIHPDLFISADRIGDYDTIPIHVDVNIVDGMLLDMEAFKKWKPDYANARFITGSNGNYVCGAEVEKMSKSKFNTMNPDDLVNKYGADTFRMYEMFLGPVEQSKPWDTKGIEGVHRFLKKLWRLFFDEQKGKIWNEDEPNAAEWKILYKAIKKIEDDTERFSFNTGVSAFMIAVNELADIKCHKKPVLEKLLIALTPYAPHVSEELWRTLGNQTSILDANYPGIEEKYLVESAKNYPIALNGKTKMELSIALDATQEQVEAIILGNDQVKKWLDGKAPKKVVYVRGRMINIVI